MTSVTALQRELVDAQERAHRGGIRPAASVGRRVAPSWLWILLLPLGIAAFWFLSHRRRVNGMPTNTPPPPPGSATVSW